MSWFKFSKVKPPYFLVVEVHVKPLIKGCMLNHASYLPKDKYTNVDFWTFHGIDEYTYSDSGFGIKYWRFLKPLPNGKTAYMKADKHGQIKIMFKKYQEFLLTDCN